MITFLETCTVVKLIRNTSFSLKKIVSFGYSFAFRLIKLGYKYLFLSLHFQSMSYLKLKGVSCKQHIVGSVFFN